MYLLTWNAEQNTIHAGLGGVITKGEATTLLDEVVAMLDELNAPHLHVELDTTRASRFSEGAFEELERLRFICSGKSAHLEVLTASLVQENEFMSPNARAILEGTQIELFEQRLAS